MGNGRDTLPLGWADVRSILTPIENVKGKD